MPSDIDLNQWLATLSIAELKSRLEGAGVTKVVMKKLASKQDNSKNGIYWEGNLNENPIPHRRFADSPGEGTSAKGACFKAGLDLEWLGPKGASAAPFAQLISYPRYPETRLTSLIKGSEYAPRMLIGSRDVVAPGRLLLLGLAGPKIVAVAIPADAPAATPLGAMFGDGPFATWPLAPRAIGITVKEILQELAGIYEMGTVGGCKITKKGVTRSSDTNAPGTTLETLLGVKPNSRDEPDFHGWELKTHVDARITLMTPAPTGGEVVTEAAEDFMRVFGWKNEGGTRWDFNGAHKATRPPGGKATTLMKVTSSDVQLVHKTNGRIAMSWSISDLLDHWSRKHFQAAYVRRMGSAASGFRFGPYVQLGEGVDWARFEEALVNGTVAVDPGYNMKVGGAKMTKQRAQFRCYSYELGALYPSVTVHDLRHHKATRRLANVDLKFGGIELPDWLLVNGRVASDPELPGDDLSTEPVE